MMYEDHTTIFGLDNDKTGRQGRQNPKVLVRNRKSEEVVENASLTSLKRKTDVTYLFLQKARSKNREAREAKSQSSYKEP